MNASSIALIPALPLFGFVIMGLFGKYFPARVSGFLGTLLLAISTCLAGYLAYDYFFAAGHISSVYQTSYPIRFSWLEFSPTLKVEIGAVIDPISVMMLVVVTLISFMVHLYSTAYMHGEKRYATYFAFLSLFTFSMLFLVLSINMIQLYMAWELVGISSFLLIGFYYEKPSAVAAAKKAFIVTRFADMFFLIGILVVSLYGGSLDIPTLISKLSGPGSFGIASPVATGFMGMSVLSWGLLFIFIGGAGKSALFPLHIWLPDAMEGPTPVSALIHAATMVVAGVYLVARLFPIYVFSAPEVLKIIAATGAFTAIFAAVIACTQFDIKRVLAYSTMSQIGYMIFALGLAGWGVNKFGFTAAMFHLFTHAIFKALLFLAAGSVIHYLHTNDMREMGALRKQMPVTHIVFLIACLAISGIPPFAGFYSKEMILGAAYQTNQIIFFTGIITAGLTAFYMFRLYFSIFWRDKAAQGERVPAHGSAAMLIPLAILAIGALTAGFIPFAKLVTYNGQPLQIPEASIVSIMAIFIAVASILISALLYMKENLMPAKLVRIFGDLHRVIFRKFFIDEIYIFITRKIIFNLIARPAAWMDRNIVDGSINLIASGTTGFAKNIKTLQSGRLQGYMTWFLGGLLILIMIFMMVN
jgi:NADH-quinone oxidoreductase subunit L